MTRNRRTVGDARARASAEVYLELVQVGNSLKVSAIDAATGVEVSVVGPATGREEELKRIAVRKLENKLAAKG